MSQITSLGPNASSPLGPSSGGTGVSNPSANTVTIAEGASPFHFVGPGTAGQLLVSGGAGADPAYVTPTSTGATITLTSNATTENFEVSFPILAPDGTAGAPSYSFANLTNAGLYQSGSQVHMSVSGGETIRFSSDNTLFQFRANMTALQYGGNFQSTSSATFSPNAQNTIYIACDPTSNTISVKLPNSANGGQIFVIKDSTGHAATHNITVTTVGGIVTIDGSTSITISSNFGCYQVIFNPSTNLYEIISKI